MKKLFSLNGACLLSALMIASLLCACADDAKPQKAAPPPASSMMAAPDIHVTGDADLLCDRKMTIDVGEIWHLCRIDKDDAINNAFNESLLRMDQYIDANSNPHISYAQMLGSEQMERQRVDKAFAAISPEGIKHLCSPQSREFELYQAAVTEGPDSYLKNTADILAVPRPVTMNACF